MRLLASCLAIFLLVTACTEVDGVPPGAGTTAPSGDEDPVFVDSIEILYLESFPVQARLAVRGSLPTPCHQARWEVEDVGWAIEVGLWSEAGPADDCIQVLEPFDISIALGSFESATSPVVLNGEEIGRLAIGAEQASGAVSLVGAGWSFGMCGGYCNADLAVEGERLVLTGRSRASEEPLYVNRGALTAVALERIGAVEERLSGVELDSVYGCPDCADGGAAYLMLARQGLTSRHEMDFGRPPELLVELHGLAMEMIGALETCGSNELVAVADDCEPWQEF